LVPSSTQHRAPSTNDCSGLDTVTAVYTLTCPVCGVEVRVPSGPHSVVATPAAGGKHAGITIDGKAAHRCADLVAPTS
jgi:hypothetical protein